MIYVIPFLFLLFLTLGASHLLYMTIKNGIGPMPSTSKMVSALIKNIPRELKGTIIELGSGWGTLAFALAKAFPHCHVIGYENSWIPYAFSKLHQRVICPLPQLTLEQADFFLKPLHQANLITCYLYPGAMLRLKPKFEKELSKGTLVISHTFAIPGWIPERMIELNDLYRSKIYFYIR